jgi:peptidoglycan hydrolase CwlO-like protein
MRNGSSDISRPSRGSKLAALALLLACVCGFAVLASGAFGADLQGKIAHRQSQLSHVRHSQAGVSASIAEQNKQIDAIIGEVSRLQQQAAAARSELAAEQAKLDRAKARLAKERKHLQVVKARLKRALMVLRNQLVAIYKSDNPDTLSVVMSSASWSDVVSETDYLESIQNYGQAAASRAKELRNEVKAAVRRMRAARDQIQQARDAVAAKEKRIEASQAQAQAQHDQLISLRAARQSQLNQLESQAQALSDNLSSLQDQAAAAAGTTIGTPVAPPVPGETAQLNSDGTASPPAGAPAAVKSAIEAANQITNTPYIWGGGHGSFSSSGYDCSGSVSFMLNGGGFLSSPLDSTGLETWGSPGPGRWITVYANSTHTWAVVAGLYFDTVGAAPSRWHTSEQSSTSGFIVRHPSGY